MRLVISLISFGILVSGPVSAKHWHEDQKHWKEHAKYEDQDDPGFDHRDHGAKNCYFQPRDARIVTEYYAPNYRELPPGLRKKLYRNGHLPPGWERTIRPLPVVVERQLAPYRKCPADRGRAEDTRLEPGTSDKGVRRKPLARRRPEPSSYGL
jgi:hypothetical protein